MKNLLLFSLIALLTSSCAFHAGMMTGNASISDNNFRVVKIIDGQASTTHILGIGGLSKSALVLEAKRDMLKNYPLMKGQAIANVTVDFKRTYILLYMTTEVTVSADVIDFNPVDKIEEFDQLYIDNLYGEKPCIKNCNFSIGDSVYFIVDGYIKKGEIGKFGNYVMEIHYKLQSGGTWVNKSKYEKTLSFQKSENHLKYFGVEIGQNVEFITEKGEQKTGVVFGLNATYAGIKYDFDDKGKFKWDLIPLGRIRTL